MVVACCYLLVATVLLPRGVLQKRRYYGVFKVRQNQTRASAEARRLERHVATPVKWLKAARALEMRSVGHLMSVEQALAQEAILTAEALADGGDPCRGGPWACPHINAQGHKEAARVRRLVGRIRDPPDRRAAVIEYARSLPEASYLRKHIEDAPFRSDTAEDRMGPPARAPKRKKARGREDYHILFRVKPNALGAFICNLPNS